jgi:hypothetical protein
MIILPSDPFGPVETIIIRTTLISVLLIEAVRFILYVLGKAGRRRR